MIGWPADCMCRMSPCRCVHRQPSVPPAPEQEYPYALLGEESAEQPGLFAAPKLVPVRRPRTRMPTAGAHIRPQWTSYKGPHRQCGHCQLVAHEAGPAAAPPIRGARWTRRHGACVRECDELKRHGFGCAHVVLLCDEHARLQRQANQPPKRRKAARR